MPLSISYRQLSFPHAAQAVQHDRMAFASPFQRIAHQSEFFTSGNEVVHTGDSWQSEAKCKGSKSWVGYNNKASG
ncbi:hypothetical protein ColTof4_00738 [Colletotrichum tofieldiae]|nr:hypothetical protein ColTof4_00738 [Colletotrichum tofieldiae]